MAQHDYSTAAAVILGHALYYYSGVYTRFEESVHFYKQHQVVYNTNLDHGMFEGWCPMSRRVAMLLYTGRRSRWAMNKMCALKLQSSLTLANTGGALPAPDHSLSTHIFVIFRL